MQADVLLESADALRAAGLDDEAAALVAEAAGIAERLGYVVALRRAERLSARRPRRRRAPAAVREHEHGARRVTGATP